MVKKKALVALLGFVCVTIATAASNREIFDSWVGCHFDENGIITTWRSYGWQM
jgi:hypothetical protein